MDVERGLLPMSGTHCRMEASAEQVRRGSDLSNLIHSPAKNWKASFLFAPDFAADVISIYQTCESYVERFESFLEYGCRLAWLFDPKAESVDVFRPGTEPETIEPPATLSADPVLPRFSCTLGDILDPAY